MHYKRFNKYLFITFLLGMPGWTLAAVNTAICVNQVGFLPDNPKGFSVVGSYSGSFEIDSSPSGALAYTGTFAAPMVNADTEQTLTLGDFSGLSTSGSYTINVPGLGQSPVFNISSTVYNNPFWLEMMGYFIRRCGNIAPSFTWNGVTYSHAACHTGDADEYYVNGDVNKTLVGVGGWHDAGDYGKYTVNTAFAVTQLLQAWEWHKAVLSQWSLPIPENGGPYPDYLAEVKWALDWLLSMQAPDGGAYHKMTGLGFEPFGILPGTDTTQRYDTPESSAATAEFCAVMSMAGRLYTPYDGGTYAAQCLSAAAKAFSWLQANPNEVLSNANASCAGAGLGFVTGTYEDPPCSYPAGSGLDDDPDHRVHADAEYWDSTGDTTALADFETRELPANDPDQVSLYWDWGEQLYGKRGPKDNGIFTYLLSSRSGRN
ncbi:MAG: glycoside hydrolase family 9 protein, partial [bacterium]